MRPIDDKENFIKDLISARQYGEFKLIPKDQIDYIDVSPKQLVSLSTSLIPFLEHDDANRALMGSNMQRQAVPLLRSGSPPGGYRNRAYGRQGFGRCHHLSTAGVVEFVDAERILVRVDENDNGDELRSGYGPLSSDQIPADQPEHLPQPPSHRAQGRQGCGGTDSGRQFVHGPR